MMQGEDAGTTGDAKAAGYALVTHKENVGRPRSSSRGLRRDVSRITVAALALLAVLGGLAIFWQWLTSASGGQWLAFGVVSILGVTAIAAGAEALLARRVLRVAIDPLQQLARSAVQISASGQARIVDADRQDEIGELARALQAWKDASMERQILADGAPIGICRMDLSGRIVTANAALVAMHGGATDEIVGRQWWDLIHADDR